MPDGIDGRTPTPLLAGREDPNRDEVFTVFHETSGKQRFEMRCAQDARYGYIWNGWADGATQYRAENMLGLSWPAMLRAAEHDDEIRKRTDFYFTRAREELYDLAADPACLSNLAENPALAPVLLENRSTLAAWMTFVGDPLATDFRTTVRSATESMIASDQ